MHLHFLKILLFVHWYDVEMHFAQISVYFPLALPLNKQKKQMPNLLSPPLEIRQETKRLKRLFCEVRATKIMEKFLCQDTGSPSWGPSVGCWPAWSVWSCPRFSYEVLFGTEGLFSPIAWDFIICIFLPCSTHSLRGIFKPLTLWKFGMQSLGQDTLPMKLQCILEVHCSVEPL